jgi:short-subunit dehydrogenase
MPGSNRVALVTGASSGIGAVFARQLAAQGYNLILVARRADRLAQMAREIESGNGVQVEVLTADLVLDADLARVESRIAGESNLELLVNNAGFGVLGNFFQSEPEPQVRMHRLHVMATLRLTHAALPGMVARGRGGIINVSSVAAFASAPGSVSYSATKAWMNNFSEGLALELKCVGSPVRVQALCPGFTRTEFQDVAKVDRKRIPDSWWMSADYVVAASLKGLERGKTVVVPGLFYKMVVLLSKLTPRVMQQAVMIRHARRSGRI